MAQWLTAVKIIDKELLAEFHRRGLCERCRQRRKTEPHHVFGRGVGGGTRLDIRLNLLALCHDCHRLYHDGKVPRAELVAIVAAREKLTTDEVIDHVNRLRWQGKFDP